MKNMNQLDLPVGHTFKLERIKNRKNNELPINIRTDLCKIQSPEELDYLDEGYSNVPKVDHAFACKTLGMGDHTSGLRTSLIERIYKGIDGITIETNNSVYRVYDFSPSMRFKVFEWLRSEMKRIKWRIEDLLKI